MKRLFLTLLLLSFGITLQAQHKVYRELQRIAREDNRTMHHLDILCNRIGGRVTGSDALQNAEQWAARCFEEWGLKVSLEKVGDMSVGFNRGGWWGRMYGEKSMTLHFATPSYTSGTKGPERGHVVIEPRTQAEFDRMKSQLRGAWVLVEGKSRGWALRHNAEADRMRDSIIRSNAEIAAYNRSVGRDTSKH